MSTRTFVLGTFVAVLNVVVVLVFSICVSISTPFELCVFLYLICYTVVTTVTLWMAMFAEWREYNG